MVEIIEVDFDNKEHCQAVIDLMNHYMQDAMGDHPPHNEVLARKMIEGLRKHCNKLCLLAMLDNEYVGLVNSFIGFGTFAAKPFINIHDVVVNEEHRGRKIGRLMLEKVKEIAQNLDCGKITLEVRHDNERAQRLYASLGYVDSQPPMYFWTKKL